MRLSEACLNAARHPRARSSVFVVDDRSSSTWKRREWMDGPAPLGAELYNPQLKMLSSPLRRCILTQKVLPSDMMVRFELTRPPPTPAGPSPRLVCQPAKMMHSRFEDRSQGTTGKGMWVACWRSAVERLAQKGAYKRLHASAAMDPKTIGLKTHSHLVRRVVQETEVMAGRMKGWQGAWIESEDDIPVRRTTREGLEELWQAHVAGTTRRIAAILDLSPLPPSSDASNPSPKVAAFLPTLTNRRIPYFRLAPFFDSVVVHPNSLPIWPKYADDNPTPAADRFLANIRANLDGTISLLQRRLVRRVGPGSTVAALAEPRGEGDLYVLFAPLIDLDPSRYDEAEQAKAEAVVPLIVALIRMRLWTGEGWAAE
ncbi:hypothetical protein RTBOTA2_006764 [Rhodotorula toruloides]|nr:hypothetical protein RTBOTA2_006764 [Rhodotorula toruloides]